MSKCMFDNTIFKRMKGKYRKSCASLQSSAHSKKPLIKCLNFSVYPYAYGLKCSGSGIDSQVASTRDC